MSTCSGNAHSNLTLKRSNAKDIKCSSARTQAHFSSQSHAQASVRSNVLLETPAFSKAAAVGAFRESSDATESAMFRLLSTILLAIKSPQA